MKKKNNNIIKNETCGKLKKLELERGITLIALIITIVILIILATVTINTVLGDNGLIKQSQLAKDLTLNSTVYENDGIANLTAEYSEVIESIGGSSEGDADLDNFKKIIASAITKEGVETTETDSAETMAKNISKILEEKTKDATATPENISEGKTAWVKGEMITGNGKDVQDAEDSKGAFQRVKIASNIGNGTYSATSIENYEELTVENFFFVITSTDIYSIANREGYAFQNNESNTTPIVSYDASTGTITLSGCSTSGSNYQGSGHTILKGDLYCVYAK